MADETKKEKSLLKEIAKTSAVIRKKYKDLRMGRADTATQLETDFKPIVEPLKRLVENTMTENDGGHERAQTMPLFPSYAKKLLKRPAKRRYAKRQRLEPHTPIDLTPYRERHPKKAKPEDDFASIADSMPLIEPDLAREMVAPSETTISTVIVDEEQPNNPPSTDLIDILWLKDKEVGTIPRKYIHEHFDDSRKNADKVYSVYSKGTQLMLGNLTFSIDNDDIIVGNTRYKGSRGLYELIFKKVPKEELCTESDKKMYKDILMRTNAHKRGNQIMGNKGHKYKHVIAPLFASQRGSGISSRIPNKMRLSKSRKDYVHWDDPNELIDRLRLLLSSEEAGHNGHNNEIISIVEELREAGLILN